MSLYEIDESKKAARIILVYIFVDIFSVYPTANSCNTVSATSKSTAQSNMSNPKKKRQRKPKVSHNFSQLSLFVSLVL